eukprot:TRINITY_DN9647_c0_g1_i1.p2 TRINITY_DN9647_c0_g1~~TRINITY_DN9647_c0_g1_i1.p2  ORF type:complete len:267 (+),score=104.55 TRINITY_DN9647_c0_g1_i1:49-801(+)
MAQSFESWWASLGPVTKFTLVTVLALGAAGTFGLVDVRHLFLFFPLLLTEPWRILTSTFFLGKFGMPFLFNTVMLVIYQKRLETEEYPQGFLGRTADHVWMMFLVIMTLLPMAYLLDLYILSMSFSMALVWIWCKRHEAQQLDFYGFAFKAGYFPWILTLIHVVLGQSPVNDVTGIVAGHVYVCFKDVFPSTHNLSFFGTPQFMYNIFPPQRVAMTTASGVQAFAPAGRAAGEPQAEVPHRWGAGRRLAD